MATFVGNVVIGTNANERLTREGWAVAVDQHGKIKAVGPENQILEQFDFEVERLKPTELLMPGFVDAHLHAPQFVNQGLHQDEPLLDWLQKYTFPAEHKFKDVEYAERMYPPVIKNTLKRGTTTAAYFASRHKEATLVLAREAAQIGQRAFVGKVNMDSNAVAEYYQDESAQQSVKDTEWLIAEIDNLRCDLVEPIITPRFALTCTGGLLTQLGHLARDRNLAVQTHVSENKAEVQVAKELFPKSKDYLEIYENTGLVGGRTLLAHGIYLSDDELARIATAGATVVHCPSSNIECDAPRRNRHQDPRHTTPKAVLRQLPPGVFVRHAKRRSQSRHRRYYGKSGRGQILRRPNRRRRLRIRTRAHRKRLGRGAARALCPLGRARVNPPRFCRRKASAG